MIMLPTIPKARLVDAFCRTDFVSFIHKTHQTLTPGSSLDMNFHINAWRIILNWCGLARSSVSSSTCRRAR